jgi:succinate dehydrogenase / fumarate reductase, membrane anchor subunit
MSTALGKVLGQGSAHTGAHHWLVQRVTAIALIPLMLWLLGSLLCMGDFSHAALTQWLASPWSATLAMLTAICLGWHAMLGVQVVIEDYIPQRGLRTSLLLLSTFLHLLFIAAGVVAVLLVALGAH